MGRSICNWNPGLVSGAPCINFLSFFFFFFDKHNEFVTHFKISPTTRDNQNCHEQSALITGVCCALAVEYFQGFPRDSRRIRASVIVVVATSGVGLLLAMDVSLAKKIKNNILINLFPTHHTSSWSPLPWHLFLVSSRIWDSSKTKLPQEVRSIFESLKQKKRSEWPNTY